VRPRMSETFRRDEKMGIFVNIYNFSPDEKSKKPNGTIEYEIVRNGTNAKVLEFTEDVKDIAGASATQVTIEKLLPLQSLEPGQYTLKMKVTDKNNNQVLTPSTIFTVS